MQISLEKLAAGHRDQGENLVLEEDTYIDDNIISNVKPAFFQDRKLSFSCFCSKKDRIYSFLKQNSGSKQCVFYQY